jgi:hypothetical protein
MGLEGSRRRDMDWGVEWKRVVLMLGWSTHFRVHVHVFSCKSAGEFFRYATSSSNFAMVAYSAHYQLDLSRPTG